MQYPHLKSRWGARKAGRARPGWRMAGNAAGRPIRDWAPPCLPSLACSGSKPPRLHLALRSARSTPSHCGRLLWEGLEHFHSLSTFLSAPRRPGLHRNYKLDTACLWSLQRGHALSCLEVLMPLMRPTGSTKGKGPT